MNPETEDQKPNTVMYPVSAHVVNRTERQSEAHERIAAALEEIVELLKRAAWLAERQECAHPKRLYKR